MTIRHDIDRVETLRARHATNHVMLERMLEAAQVALAASEASMLDIEATHSNLCHQRDLMVEHVFSDILSEPGFDDIWDHDIVTHGVAYDAELLVETMPT